MKKLVFIAPALAALALSACGSGSDSGSTGTQGSSTTASASSGGTSTTGGGRGGFMNDEVRACLQQEGVDIPQGGNGGPSAGGGTPPDGTDGGPPQGGLPGGGGYGPPQDGAGGGGGFGGQTDEERQKFQDALKKCGVDMPQGGVQRGQGGQNGAPDVSDAAYQKRVNAYVACVRDNGFDLPDPDFSGDGPIFDPDQVDQSDKTFQAASAKCQDKLRPAAGTSTTSTTT